MIRNRKSGQHHCSKILLVFLIVTVTIICQIEAKIDWSKGKTVSECDSVIENYNFQRIRPGSKYLVTKNLSEIAGPDDLPVEYPYTWTTKVIYSIRDYCHEHGFEMPSTRHYNDWKSLQIFMQSHEFIKSHRIAKSPNDSVPIYHVNLGNHFDPDLGKFVADNEIDESFQIWETEHPMNENYAVILKAEKPLIPQRLISILPKHSTGAISWSHNRFYVPYTKGDCVIKRARMCQIPSNVKCYDSSNEQNDNKYDPDQQIFIRLDTNVNRKVWIVSRIPSTYEEAIKQCKDEDDDFQIWHDIKNLKPEDNMALADSLVEGLETDGHYGHSAFHGGKNGNEYSTMYVKYTLSDKTHKLVKSQVKKLSNIPGKPVYKPKFLFICEKEKGPFDVGPLENCP